MNESKAFEIVYNNIVDCGAGMFTGSFDAKHGNENFMYGINTVMEYIAYKADRLDEFCKIWEKNFSDSLDRVNKL